MENKIETSFFKKGIWIKEQEGVLTMGVLDDRTKEVMVASQELSAKLIAMESEMVQALYGEDRQPFNPGVVNLELLFKKLKARFPDLSLNISLTDPDKKPFKCEFDPLLGLLESLVKSSTTKGKKPLVSITAALTQDHLCLIYRDSEAVSDPSLLGAEFFLRRNRINASVQFKKSGETKPYYDITIPPAS